MLTERLHSYLAMRRVVFNDTATTEKPYDSL
jgi:hypothetical protein